MKNKDYIIDQNGTLLDYVGSDVFLELPKEVRAIDSRAFSNHPQIDSIDPGDNEDFFCIDRVLYQRDGEDVLLLWTPPDLESDFRIPMNVTIIAGSAFLDRTRLRSLYIPGSVCWIDLDSFDGCDSLAEIIVDPENAYYQSASGTLISQFDPEDFGTRKPTVLFCPPKIEGHLFIPDGVVDLCSFERCDLITSISIPESVQSLGFFPGSSLFKSIEVRGSGRYPFYSVDGVLYEIEDRGYFDRTVLRCFPAGKTGEFMIPEGVDAIGGLAFFHSRLSKIDLGSVKEIECAAFRGCFNLKSLFVPKSVRKIDPFAFVDCLFDLAIDAPKDVLDGSPDLGEFYGKVSWNDR